MIGPSALRTQSWKSWINRCLRSFAFLAVLMSEYSLHVKLVIRILRQFSRKRFWQSIMEGIVPPFQTVKKPSWGVGGAAAPLTFLRVSRLRGSLILLAKSIPYKFGRPLVDRICFLEKVASATFSTRWNGGDTPSIFLCRQRYACQIGGGTRRIPLCTRS